MCMLTRLRVRATRGCLVLGGLLVCLLATYGIGESALAEPPASPLAGEEPRPRSPGLVRSDEQSMMMLDHYDLMLAARDALIFNRLPEVREAFAELARSARALRLPEKLHRKRANLSSDAQAASKVDSLAGLAGGFAKVSQRCGDCHGTDRSIPLPPYPPGQDLKPHMARHLWLLDRLWEGLAVPDGGSWSAGVEQLSLPPVACPMREVGTQDLQNSCAPAHALRALHSELRGAQTKQRKREGLARVITLCGTCHVQNGVTGLSPVSPGDEAHPLAP
jgi:cytochrome c553